jgi:succinate dehydrogenase/fumarate reductase flavoprotein subunit
VHTVEAWDDQADVIVVGYGAAGAVAAIEAHDAGARVLLLEKMPFPGGLSIVSAGGIRICFDKDEALRYLEATCGDRTPPEILRSLVEGMAIAPDYVRKLAAVNGAKVKVAPALGNYPFPGCEALGYCEIESVPALEGATSFHAVRGIKPGCRLFKVLEDNITARGIRVVMNARADRLLTAPDKTVRGVRAVIDGQTRHIKARKAVIMTAGGFEASEEMKRDYFQAAPVLTGSFRGNTGDGIKMCQEAGAALWHMWHYHGPYGLKHSDPDYPFAFYLKAVPMWTPGRLDQISDLGIIDAAGKPLSQKSLARMAWILVDQNGRRFMDEYPPYPGDTGIRPLDAFDPKMQGFPRIPAFMVFDEDGRKMYPMGRAVLNDRDAHYEWSPDNLKEVALGIFEKADTLEELAAKMRVPPAHFAATVRNWNAAVENGHDGEHGRMPETMVPIRTPPFYFGRIYPVVINTQGGPKRNVRQEVVDPFGEPIPRLYAAGELGSIFGHIYMSGGNLAECFVGGWTAGRNAAALPAWDDA